MVWLVWSIPIAGIIQLSLLWLATYKTGIKITFSVPKWNKDIGNLVKLAIPAALAGGVLQINLLVGQLVASQETGAISFLYFADRLYQLPLGIAGIAVGTVLLPKLSRHLKTGDSNQAQITYSQSAEMVWFVALPSSFALCLIPFLLFQLFLNMEKHQGRMHLLYHRHCHLWSWTSGLYDTETFATIILCTRRHKNSLRFAVISMLLNAILAIALLKVWVG